MLQDDFNKKDVLHDALPVQKVDYSDLFVVFDDLGVAVIKLAASAASPTA